MPRSYSRVPYSLELQALAQKSNVPEAFSSLKTRVSGYLQQQYLREMNSRPYETVKGIKMMHGCPEPIWALCQPAAESIIRELNSEKSPLVALFGDFAGARLEVFVGGKKMHAVFAESEYAGFMFRGNGGILLNGYAFRIALTENDAQFFQAKEQLFEFLCAYESNRGIEPGDWPILLAKPDSKHWAACACEEGIRKGDSAGGREPGALERTEIPGLADAVAAFMVSLREKTDAKVESFAEAVDAIADRIARELAAKDIDATNKAT